VLLVCGHENCSGLQTEHLIVNKLLIVIPLVALSACVAQPKKDSETLLVVDDNHNCELIAHVVGDRTLGTSKTRADEVAVTQAKNRASAAGANAIYFEDTHSKIWGSMVLADALLCSQRQFEQSSQF